jgi:hypothetical protein
MKNKVLMVLAAVVMVAFLSSCGKEPVEKINAVNAAIDSAKAMEANVYVPVEFAQLQDSMKVIMADIEVQKSRMFKKFGPATVKLDQTLTLANEVTAKAVAKKEEVKKEVETLMTDIKTVIEENKKLFVRAPRGKEGAAVLEQMKAEMATVETSVTEAQGMYDKAAYMDAYNKVKAAKETADKINGELKDAIKKVGGKI